MKITIRELKQLIKEQIEEKLPKLPRQALDTLSAVKKHRQDLNREKNLESRRVLTPEQQKELAELKVAIANYKTARGQAENDFQANELAPHPDADVEAEFQRRWLDGEIERAKDATWRAAHAAEAATYAEMRANRPAIVAPTGASAQLRRARAPRALAEEVKLERLIKQIVLEENKKSKRR
jgi:hypothetical protein